MDIRIYKEVAYYKEGGKGVRYRSSEVSIIVHAVRKTSLTAAPSEIGSETNPVDEGTSVEITATLTEASGSNVGKPIQGKTLHLYDTEGTEIDTRTTDENGQATFTYEVNAEDDGKSLTIVYLGD